MTTNEQPTGPAHIEASLVQLILLRSSARLPIPRYRVSSDERIVLEFTSLSALQEWADELKARGATDDSGLVPADDCFEYSFMILVGWPCEVHLRASREQRPEPLADETLDALAAVTS